MSDVTPREIRAMLQQRLPELLNKLFPRYAITYPVFTPLNPTRNDRTPGSFVIWTQGAAAGGFNEYSPSGPPASGDVIDLIAYLDGQSRDRGYALAFARDFLGLKAMNAAQKRAVVSQARDHAAQATAQQSEQALHKIRLANAMWNKTLPIVGSLAEVYLASRRIPLMLLKNREDDLRFMPDLDFWSLAEWDRSVKPWVCIKAAPCFPAMVAALRNGAGDLTAVHCTFLRRDGTGKANVGPGVQAKLIRGVARGSVIRLTRGGNDMTLTEARAAGIVDPYGIAEGIENGLSVALAVPEARVVAAGSFDLMLQAPVPDVADPVIYIRDNDGNAKADDRVRDRIDELAALGKQASQMAPHEGKDFNDLM
jgi:hypothetical protein